MSAFEAMLGTLYADPNLGVAATLSLGSPGATYAIIAIDRTDGVTVNLGGLDVETMRPAAVVRAIDLDGLGLAASDLDNGTITVGGALWRIASVRPQPGPQGEAAGEYLLLLEAAS